MLVTEISIDLAGLSRFEYVIAKQADDNSRIIQVQLLNNGKIYVLDSGTKARVSITKPDKTEVLDDCTINNNRVEIVLDANMLAAAGTAIAEIILTGSDGTVTSASFDIKIIATVTGKNVESSSEYKSFKEALKALGSIDDKIAQKAERAAVVKLTADMLELQETGATAEVIEAKVQSTIDELIADGTLAAMTIPDGSITKEKFAADISLDLEEGSVTVEKTDMFESVKANVNVMEAVTTDSNYLAIRNAKANTKYYISKSIDTTNWGVGAFVPLTVYSLNETTNAKTNIGSCTRETVDGIEYEVFTPTADYELLGFFRADGNPNPFELYVNYAYYGTEVPFILEDAVTGMSEAWKTPMLQHMEEDIKNIANEAREEKWNGEETNGIVTPEKTDFMQLANRGSGNYNMGNPALNIATYEPADNTGAILEDYYGKWLDVMYSAFGKLINGGSYATLGYMLMVPLSAGEYWLRIPSRILTKSVRFAMFDNPDIIAEPTQYETLEYDLMYNSANWTDYEGNAQSGVVNLGTWEYVDDSGETYSSCFIPVYKFTVPEGKYAFIIIYDAQQGVSHSPGISEHYDINNMYTIFDYDPIDNILEIVKSNYNYKSLAIEEEFARGFLRTIFSDKYVLEFFKKNAQDIIPSEYNRHTFGKTLIMYGDSLTQYSGGDGLSGEGFLSQINQYLGMTMTQKGYAGSNWTGTGAGSAPTRVQELLDAGTEYDVIILAWGTNSDENLGTVDDAAASDGSLCAVMKWAVSSIRAKYPYAGLGIVIPPAGSGGCDEAKANLMIECCEHKSMHVPYLDLWHHSGIVVDNKTTGEGGLGSDMVHLYATGRNRYASALGQFVERICPYI